MTNQNYHQFKHDQGKPLSAIIMQDFPNAYAAISDVATFGANKYARSSWINVPDALTRYSDAMMRHLNAHHQGHTLDGETGLTHLAHFAWNALAVLELTAKAEKLPVQHDLDPSPYPNIEDDLTASDGA